MRGLDLFVLPSYGKESQPDPEAMASGLLCIGDQSRRQSRAC
jgi:hypothetical protein